MIRKLNLVSTRCIRGRLIRGRDVAAISARLGAEQQPKSTSGRFNSSSGAAERDRRARTSR